MEKKEKGDVPMPSVPRAVWAPLPETTRGYGLQLNVSPKGDLFAYGAGRLVVIRSIKDPTVCEHVFWEHKARVTVAAFSPNGEWVASGDESGTVLVWGIKNKFIKNTVPACRKICDLAWSPDGNKIIAVGDGSENKAKVFSWDSATNVGVIEFHSKCILSCSYRPVRPFSIVTASEDLAVNFYPGPPFKWSNSIKDFDRYPNCVRFSPDGSKFAVVSSCPKIQVYEGKEGKQKLAEFKDPANGHKSSIFSFCWSPDGKQLVTASSDKTCKIWDVESGKVVTTLVVSAKPGVEDQQVGVLWAAAGLLSVSLSGAINVWDPAKPGAPARVIQGHQVPPSALCSGCDGRVFSADPQGRVCVWDRAGAAHWLTGPGHGQKPIAAAAVTADGSALWTAGQDDQLRITPTSSAAFSASSIPLGGQPVALAIATKDPSLGVVVLAQEKAVLIRAGKVAGTQPLPFRPTSVAFSPDDHIVAIGGADMKVYLFSVGANALKAEGAPLTGHLGRILAVRFAADGVLASTCANRLIHLWKDGKILNPTSWTFHAAGVMDVAFAPSASGARPLAVATCSADQDILVWRDLATFQHKFDRLILAHSQGADHLAFADEHTLLSSGQDRCIKVWAV